MMNYDKLKNKLWFGIRIESILPLIISFMGSMILLFIILKKINLIANQFLTFTATIYSLMVGLLFLFLSGNKEIIITEKT